jgi:hypothetical protein
MSDILWDLVAVLGWTLVVLVGLLFCQFVFFVTVKLGTYAYLVGRDRFEQDQKRRLPNGKQASESKP